MNPETLRQLIANCRRPTGRFIARPHEWTPHRVELPEMPGYYFSEAGAWELIAEKLASGHLYEEITLSTPAGAPALTMLLPISPVRAHLYVKVQIGQANKAIGRSFHYSDFN